MTAGIPRRDNVDGVAALRIEQVDGLAGLDPAAWNRLSDPGYPFARYEFLQGLEAHDCLAPHGWFPAHLLAWDAHRLVGALPLYVKTNSYGEFVFDWSWADAYERGGRRYYPKLVSAIPFTPATGARLLVDREHEHREQIQSALIAAALTSAREHEVSSLHCLFPNSDEVALFRRQNLLIRNGCQYHWENNGYANFADFLNHLNAKRRKQIRRERRCVEESGIKIEVLKGADIDDRVWGHFYQFYCSTFDRKWGEPRFTLPFLQHLGSALPDATLLFMASLDGRYIAGALALQGSEVLYGRHWGCSEFHRYLHFELCYYKTIEFCIETGLQRLDAGAQGEHKVMRGFVPRTTYSAHWIRDSDFSSAVADFLRRETALVGQHMHALDQHVPFRHDPSREASK